MTDVDLFKQQKLVNSFLKSCRFFSLPTHSCYAKHTYFFVSLFGNIKVRQKSWDVILKGRAVRNQTPAPVVGESETRIYIRKYTNEAKLMVSETERPDEG